VLSPETPDDSSSFLPIQGRLTDAAGIDLNGNFDLTFRLYDVLNGGTALCEYTASFVNVEDGLFHSYMRADDCPIEGQQLYLGIEVEDDGEMTPRQLIHNVPYAWSLRPGATVKGTLESDPVLYVYNQGAGEGIWASSMDGEGLHGSSFNGTGVKGYSPIGTGVEAESNTGPALAAKGTGIITSAAETTLWVSGSGLRPYHQSDSTIVDMDTIGGAKIFRGATAGNKNVMLPIVIPGTLYGQAVTVTDLDIYWVGDTDFDGIAAILLRRQTGVCATSSCYATIVYDATDYLCWEDEHPTGCVTHKNLTNNNVLSEDSGVLYLTLELSFSGASTWVEIGGIRLTLEHE
jgi:hypothetical protein